MEDRFINPYTDYGFKKLFGTEQNADLLTSFLNALIAGDDQPSDPIVSITYKNVEHIGEINTMRSSYFDVFCQTQSGTDFIVNGKELYDKLTLIYLEMPKLEKREFKLETMRDKWMYALYSLCYTDEQPEELKEEVFLKLFREAEVARFNETQLLSYRESLRDLWDCYSTWECASQEGIEIGVAKGKEIGLAEGKELGLTEGEAKANLDNARKMKALGIDDETIAKVTGLKPEEFETLEK